MNPYSPPAAMPPYPDAPPVYGAPPGAAAGGVTELAVDLMRQTRPWVMFLSILSFLGSAFMLLAGLLMVGVGLMASGPEKAIQAGVGAFYLPLAAVYVYPGIKMWMYGSAIGRLLTSRAPADLEAALKQQKSFWKFCGIAAIVMIGLYILIFIGAMIFGVAMGMKGMR
jgi:membrane protein YqaA with SNARE-associated domain